MTREEAIYLLRNTAFLAPSLEPIDEAIDMACEALKIADAPQFDSGIPKNALRSDCTGCRFVGTYDTEFPCANCTRKNKDYYDSE